MASSGTCAFEYNVADREEACSGSRGTACSTVLSCPGGGAESPAHEAVHAPLRLANVLLHALEEPVGLLEACCHVLPQLLVPLVHLREALAHQLALVPELFLDADHALAQLDLLDGRRLAEELLGQPLAKVVFRRTGCLPVPVPCRLSGDLDRVRVCSRARASGVAGVNATDSGGT